MFRYLHPNISDKAKEHDKYGGQAYSKIHMKMTKTTVQKMDVLKYYCAQKVILCTIFIHGNILIKAIVCLLQLGQADRFLYNLVNVS